MNNLAEAKKVATSLRRRTRDNDVILLCDAVLGFNSVKTAPVAKLPPPSTSECPVCAERRAAKAKAQKAWRRKRGSLS